MRYFAATAALQAFSLNRATKSLYRKLGEGKLKQVLHPRAQWILDAALATRPTDQSRFLELGTGWIHAYSLYPALFTDATIYGFDVQDSRSLASLLRAVPRLREQLPSVTGVSEAMRIEATKRLDRLQSCQTLEEVYGVLRIRPIIDPQGALPFDDEHFDLVYAMDVFEHVPAATFQQASDAWFRVAKRGASLVTQVGLDDHNAHYDKRKSMKEYLRYPRSFAEKFLDSDLLYINRMTGTEILTALKKSGFEIDQAIRETMPLTIPIHADYRGQSEEDLATFRLTIQAHKPC